MVQFFDCLCEGSELIVSTETILSYAALGGARVKVAVRVGMCFYCFGAVGAT